jgi:hypothetical protein
VQIVFQCCLSCYAIEIKAFMAFQNTPRMSICRAAACGEAAVPDVPLGRHDVSRVSLKVFRGGLRGDARVRRDIKARRTIMVDNIFV